MTVDRAAVLDALREASAEGFATSKQVAAVLGIKGASPLIRTVRKELEVMARQGRIEAEVNPVVGKRFRYVEEPSGPAGIVARMERRAKAVEDEEPDESPEESEDEAESPEEPEEEPDEESEEESEDEDDRPRLVRRSLPTATHRVLRVLSDGKARTLKELKGYGVSSTTLKPMREEGLVLSEPDGYRITDDGLRGLSEIEEDWPQLKDSVYEYEEYVEFDRPRPKGRMPTTVHAMLCALADGRPRRAKDLMAAGIGEKTHGTVYQHGWCERTGLGYAITDAGRARLDEIERDWPELRAKGRDSAVPAAEEPVPAPKAEKLPFPQPGDGPLMYLVGEDGSQCWMNTRGEYFAVGDHIDQACGLANPDPKPDDPPMTEAENAVVEGVEAVTVYRLTLRTARGVRTVDVSDPYVIGKADATAFLVGMAARVRTVGGRVQIGHIVDDEWRDAL
jgi:DNA-binding PadR family transcriptional regulator